MDNWVKLRIDCSPFKVFVELRKGAKEDAETRNKGRTDAEVNRYSFDVTNGENDRVFTVWRHSPDENLNSAVDFSWSNSGILVRGFKGQTLIEATLTLDDEGNCKLRVGLENLTSWQFRKRALEPLFFPVQGNSPATPSP
ncbi:MAG TPA: hypothetical protein VG860_12935 [Terriglobia bacterium]|jgi:hypothetical protein|nr:hypothetical protein [Terriglobia bacterium]